MLLTLFSCSNELPEELENSTLNYDTKAVKQRELVEIVDGVLRFKDAEVLCNAIVNPEIINTAKCRTNTTNFKSLGSKYVELERSYDLMVVNKEVEGREFSIDDDVIENRVRSSILADFLNKDGMMIVGDKAVKVIGDYAYSASIDSYKNLSQLSEKELKSSENVTVDRIIVPLVSDDDSVIQTKASSGGTYNRSFVFIPTDNNKRREHVIFNPHLLVIQNAGTSIVIEMEGRAQKRHFLGGWLIPFRDEMVWAEIHLNSGSWHYNQPPLGGYPIPQGTNNFTTGLMARSAGTIGCRWSKLLGNTGGVSDVKAMITYKMKKSNSQPSDWQDTYINNYTSIRKD